MRTDKQIAASRANGAKSRGPITPAGKAVSSQNALKYGLYAAHHIIRGEDPAAFAALVDSFYDTYGPTDAVQTTHLKEIIRATWLLDRFTRLETELWNREAETAKKLGSDHPFSAASRRASDDFKLIQRRIDSAHRTLQRHTSLLEKLIKSRPAPKLAPQPIPRKRITPSLGSFLRSSPPSNPPSPTPDAVPPEPRPLAPDPRPLF
jgi:hypothetical protein